MANGNGNGTHQALRVLGMRVVESFVIGSIAVGSSMYVSVNVLGVRIDGVDRRLTEVAIDSKKMQLDVTALRISTAALSQAATHNEKSMDQVQDRLKNLSGRVSDLERAVPRQERASPWTGL